MDTAQSHTHRGRAAGSKHDGRRTADEIKMGFMETPLYMFWWSAFLLEGDVDPAVLDFDGIGPDGLGHRGTGRLA